MGPTLTLTTWGNERNLDYVEVHGSESRGPKDGFGIRIFATVDHPLSDEERIAATRAADIVTEAIGRESRRLNPQEQWQRKKERDEVLSVFHSYFAVQEIPNGYCGKFCCSQKPWFRVLTEIGWVTIGWRKSVINIDWSDTVQKLSGDELFPGASFTTGRGYDKNQYCHAYGYERATEQLKVVMNVTKEQKGLV